MNKLQRAVDEQLSALSLSKINMSEEEEEEEEEVERTLRGAWNATPPTTT